MQSEREESHEAINEMIIFVEDLRYEASDNLKYNRELVNLNKKFGKDSFEEEKVVIESIAVLSKLLEILRKFKGILAAYDITDVFKIEKIDGIDEVDEDEVDVEDLHE